MLNAQFAKSGVDIYLEADKGRELEKQGWETWLMTLFPFWFEEEFSKEHIQYWELHWKCIQLIRQGKEPDTKDATKMLLLGRGLGKSAVIECARIMRAAILKKGYSLIISETDDQAQEHLGNCRVLIEHPDSQLIKYYPDMAIGDGGEIMKGMPTADRKEMFITKSGYIFRSKGLAAKMRGLRVGVNRPDDIAFDDIDDVNDSLAVSENKLRLITASILPVQARKFVTIDFGQNLISKHSVVNQIFEGKTDALANKTVIGVANAFETLNIDSKLDEMGKMRHTILETSVPSWTGLDIARAQKFLDNSGLQTFMAEYQNEFDQFKSGNVIPEYNEATQVITWSEFEKVFGVRKIPRHWTAAVGLDVGYSDGQHPHYSAWSFIATAAMNSGMGGTLFVYRSRTFRATSIDDQAEKIKSDLYVDKSGVQYEKDEMIKSWQMSHERTGEMMTLHQKYKLPFGKFRYYKAEDGVAQWRHLSRADKTKPNPFKNDKRREDGQWELGKPSMYYIVDDDQIKFAHDDNGMKLLRDQVSTWEYVPVKMTETGLTSQKPSKVGDDVPDSIKSIVCWFGNTPTAFTMAEELQQKVEKHTSYARDLKGENDLSAQISRSMAQVQSIGELRKEGWSIGRDGKEIEPEWESNISDGW